MGGVVQLILDGLCVLVSDVLYNAGYEEQATLVELCYVQGHPAK